MGTQTWSRAGGAGTWLLTVFYSWWPLPAPATQDVNATAQAALRTFAPGLLRRKTQTKGKIGSVPHTASPPQTPGTRTRGLRHGAEGRAPRARQGAAAAVSCRSSEALPEAEGRSEAVAGRSGTGPPCRRLSLWSRGSSDGTRWRLCAPPARAS